MLKQLLSDLERLHNPGVAQNLSWFFKTDEGEYGYGDVFAGIKVPQVRAVAKNYENLSLEEIRSLAGNKYHEYRFCALAILTKQFEKSKYQSKQLFDLYMQLVDAGYINNWDLVDISAPRMGRWLINRSDTEKFLLRLAKHKDLWHQRLSIMFTFAFIQQGILQPTLQLAEYFLDHPHDLIHKSSGWMLRELGKRDLGLLKNFLDQNAHVMPRTMLRYAIEKLPESQRKKYLAMKAQLQPARGR